MTPPHVTIGRLTVYLDVTARRLGRLAAPAATYICPMPLITIRWARAHHTPRKRST
jgi:hypothetical protein